MAGTWLVCGGRDFADRDRAYSWLDRLAAHHGTPDRLIHGDARGADRIGRDWARDRGVPIGTYPADWTRHGRAAGPIRNQQMLDEGHPSLVIALPGGRGTADMIARSQAAGIKTVVAH